MVRFGNGSFDPTQEMVEDYWACYHSDLDILGLAILKYFDQFSSQPFKLNVSVTRTGNTELNMNWKMEQ
jgi:hypothetical protein